MHPVNNNQIPDSLLAHAGVLTIMEVSDSQYRVAMREFSGVFFGRDQGNKFYIKGTRKDLDFIKNNYS